MHRSFNFAVQKPSLMMRILFSSFCSILLFPFFVHGQGDGSKDPHGLAIRGDFQIVQESASELFQEQMNGVIGADLSLEVPFANSLFVAGGGNFSQFERKGDPTNLLQEETKMYVYGPFVKAGYRPYMSRIFYMEFSVKGSYRFLDFDSPSCKNSGEPTEHSSTGFSMMPKMGFWWDTGDGLDFGAVVGHELLWNRFDPDHICYRLPPEPADNDSKYRFWHFGFAFTADLIRPK